MIATLGARDLGGWKGGEVLLNDNNSLIRLVLYLLSSSVSFGILRIYWFFITTLPTNENSSFLIRNHDTPALGAELHHFLTPILAEGKVRPFKIKSLLSQGEVVVDMRIEEVIRKVKEVLDEKDSLREEALQITREIVRLSGDSIKAMHRGELKTAEERLRRAGELVSLLREKLGNHPDLYYTGHVQTANQEFTEATLLYHYLTDKNFPGYEDLGVPPQDYILGVGDFIGELRRYFLISLMEGDIERAEETYRFMEEVYEELMTLEYPKGLVNVRQKQDQARYILERTLEDLTRAKLNMKLERKLEEAINVGESGKSSREAE
ncbi:Uncharacterized protein MJ0175 [Thermococcus chitonophagus]|uniref:Uncharacterized protein MJ0175 n=2 Tax=Thermococcus chitonophagus TaxID=54262 RepID=A0A160VRM7_9EURY|nr:Uncharacterized protein MJ0175 [Thermococcus chitonophagus]